MLHQVSRQAILQQDISAVFVVSCLGTGQQKPSLDQLTGPF